MDSCRSNLVCRGPKVLNSLAIIHFPLSSFLWWKKKSVFKKETAVWKSGRFSPELNYSFVFWPVIWDCQLKPGVCRPLPGWPCSNLQMPAPDMALLWVWTQRACHGGWKKAGMLVLCSPRAPWSSHFKEKVWSSEAMGRGPLQDRSIVNLVVMTMMKRAKELNQMNSELVLKTQIQWLPPSLFFFFLQFVNP